LLHDSIPLFTENPNSDSFTKEEIHWKIESIEQQFPLFFSVFRSPPPLERRLKSAHSFLMNIFANHHHSSVCKVLAAAAVIISAA